MKKIIEYIKRKKTFACIILFGIFFAILYYNNTTTQKYIAESPLIQSIFIFLTVITFAGIFFSTTLRKELNHNDVANIVKEKQTATKEIIKQIDRRKLHDDRSKGKGKKV
jgi:hypothetical protein